MKKVNKSLQRYTIIVFVFVISLVVIGVSVSFSFFNIGVDGSSTFTPPPAS